VGLYPARSYVRPPGRAEFDKAIASLNVKRREMEKKMEEDLRKSMERLSPERRAKMQRVIEKGRMDAQIEAEKRSDPCKVIAR
jgi:hypothetical protein